MEFHPLQVVCAVIIHKGRILCCQRQEDPRKSISGKWEFPGGKVEQGESHQQALKREISEEINLDIEVGEFLMTVSHDYDEFSLELHAYKATCQDISPIEIRDHAAVKWLLPEELHNLDWAAADIPIYQILS